MKFVILTDWTGCPRIFPKSERVDLDDTYPYLLRKEFDTSKFWQLSIGNQISKLLIDNARGYLMNWHPNYIILGTGINDARPEFLSNKITEKLNFEGKLSFLNKFIKKFYLSPFLIKLFNKHRVSEKQFLKSITSLKKTFENSKIIWLEIYSHNNYEIYRPGVLKRKNYFNRKIKKILGNDFLEISEEISNNNFYTKDFHHFTKQGHHLIAKKIIEHIKKDKKKN